MRDQNPYAPSEKAAIGYIAASLAADLIFVVGVFCLDDKPHPPFEFGTFFFGVVITVPFFLALPLVPFLIVYYLGQCFGIGSYLYYMLTGVVTGPIAWILGALLFSLGAPSGPVPHTVFPPSLGRMLLNVSPLLLSGGIGGSIFWWIAIKSSGKAEPAA